MLKQDNIFVSPGYRYGYVTDRKLYSTLIYCMVQKQTIWAPNNPMETTVIDAKSLRGDELLNTQSLVIIIIIDTPFEGFDPPK